VALYVVIMNVVFRMPVLIPGILFLSFGLATSVPAATTSWTNSLSGFWRIGPSNWSLNQPPTSADNALITNTTTKTVTVDVTTPLTNLTVYNLTLSAPVGITNTLLLSDLTTNTALQINNQLLLYRGAALRITNSALRLPGGTGALNNYGGAITLENGLLDYASANLMRLGRYSTNQASVMIKGGTLSGTQLQIGQDLGLGTLTLSNGIVKMGSFMSLGASSSGNPANGGTGVVFVAGGELLITNDVLEIGYQGNGQMTLNGGKVATAYLSMGNVEGTTGTLNINGGQLLVRPRNINDLARIGNAGYGQMNVSGGLVSIGAEFVLGDSPDGITLGTGIVSVTGGQIFATNALTSIDKYGNGQMTISNASVTLTTVSVGRHANAVGTLRIQENAQVYCLDALSIGRLSEKVGIPSQGHVYVTGGLLSLAGDDIWVGRGGTGELTVSNGTVEARSLFVGMSSIDPVFLTTNHPSGLLTLAGGNTLISSNIAVGTSLSSTGNVVMTGGTLTITNPDANTRLNIDQGTFTMNEGSITMDHLYLTNVNGGFTLNGGNMSAKNITVNNGASFIVGNGVSPAMLVLQGGTFSFANGLVISPNATVTGCGTIIGPIINNGTLSTNCETSTTITVRSLVATESNLTVFFPTIYNQSYTLQSSSNLSTGSWVSLPPSKTGTGGIMSLSDTNTTDMCRFYRIHTP